MISVNTKLDEVLAEINGSDADDRRDYVRSLWEFDSDDYNGKFQDNICPECGTKTLVKDKIGEIYCKSCGLVNDNNIDKGPDWNGHSYEGDKNLRHAEPRYNQYGKEFFRWTHDLKSYTIILHMTEWDKHTAFCINERMARHLLVERYNRCCYNTFKHIPKISIIGANKFAWKYNITRNEAKKCLDTSDRYIKISKYHYMDISRTDIINQKLLSIILSSKKKVQIISTLQRLKKVKSAKYNSLLEEVTDKGLQTLEKKGIIIQLKIPRIYESFYYFSDFYW